MSVAIAHLEAKLLYELSSLKDEVTKLKDVIIINL